MNSDNVSFIKKYVNIILVVVSVLLTLLSIEVILHFTNYRALLATSSLPRNYFIKDDVTGYDIGKNNKKTTHTILDLSYEVWSNNIGCFDRDYNGEVPYIYLAGDSFTWGYAPFESSYGVKIESLTGVRVLKCGVSAYGTNQELIKATRILAGQESPELIIVGYTRDNDYIGDFNFPDTTVRNGYLVNNMTRSSLTDKEKEEVYSLYETYCTSEDLKLPWVQFIKCRLKNNSILYNLLKSAVRDFAAAIIPYKVLVGTSLVVEKKETPSLQMTDLDFNKHLENISAFKKLADQKGSKLLFVLVPSNANEGVKKFLENERIQYLDLMAAFEKYSKIKPLRWNHDHHWNIAGNRLVGALVSKYILQNDILKVSNKEELLERMDNELLQEFGEL